MDEETKQHATLTIQASHIKERPVESETFFSMSLDPNAIIVISNAAGANARINIIGVVSLGSGNRFGSLFISAICHIPCFETVEALMQPMKQRKQLRQQRRKAKPKSANALFDPARLTPAMIMRAHIKPEIIAPNNPNMTAKPPTSTASARKQTAAGANNTMKNFGQLTKFDSKAGCDGGFARPGSKSRPQNGHHPAS